MFYAPELLRKKSKGELLSCWLAGTLSEAMFKNKVSKMRILKINIAESGEEIMVVVSGRGFNGTPRFSLYLSSQLVYGLIKIFAYQSDDLQKSATKCCAELSARLTFSKKKNKRSNVQIDLEYAVRDDFPISAPDLLELLGRPTPRDENRIFEISPESHKKMMEATDLHWDFRMPGEEIDLPIPSIADIPKADMTDFSLGIHDDPIVEEIVYVPPQKRLLSPGTRIDSPSKKQRVRKSLRDEVRTAANDAYNGGETAVLPELDNESHPLPIDASNDVVPVDVRDQLDNLPAVNIEEPVDAPALLDTMVPVDVVDPEEPSISIPIVQPTMQPRAKRRRGKTIDAKISLPANKQFPDRDNQATIGSMLIAHPGRMIEPPIFKLPLRDLKCDDQHFPLLCCNIQDLISIDMLIRYDDANYFPLDTTDLQCPEMLEPYLPKDLLTTVEGKLVQSDDKTKSCTIDEPVEGIVQQLPEIRQPEIINEPTIDNVSAAQIPIENIEHTELSENTSGPTTMSVGKVEMLTNPPESEEAIVRLPSPVPVVENIEEFLPPPPPKDRRESTNIRHSKAKSPDALIDITDEPNLSSSEITEQSAWTKKDLEACLEVHFHDRDIVTFEDLAPSNDNTVIEAMDCFFLILELYSEYKIDLTQDETDGPIIIKKFLAPESMNISQ